MYFFKRAPDVSDMTYTGEIVTDDTAKLDRKEIDEAIAQQNDGPLLDAFVQGARWAYDNYSEYAPMDGEELIAARVQAYRWLRVKQFKLVAKTVFIGTISYVPSRYNEPFAYSGPVLVGQKADGTLTFSTDAVTVSITEHSLEWKIDEVIYTPTAK